MAGKTFLLNTSRRIADLTHLSGEWFVVAQAVDRIPLPWLCLFDGADLLPCLLTYLETRENDGQRKHLARKFEIRNPSVTVRQAKANLAIARPLFERLARDAQVGARHWRQALDSLADMTLEYLTLDPTKRLLVGDLAASAADYALAFEEGPEALAAKARLAGIAPDADAEANFEALDGGFLDAGRHLRRTRTAEEARDLVARLAALGPDGIMPPPSPPPPALPVVPPAAAPEPAAARPAAPAPEAAPSTPSANFWNDERQLERGRRAVSVAIGPSMFMGARRYYSVRLTNRSNGPLRVRMYAGFERLDSGEHALATGSRQWFPAQTFVDCFSAPPDGWLAPGQTVAHLTQSAVNRDEHLAFWIEDAARTPFIVVAPVGESENGGRLDGEGWVLGLAVDALGDDEPLVQREIDRLVARLEARMRDTFGRELKRDMDGLRWLDDTIEAMHADPDRSQWEELVPMFGAFVGEVSRDVKPRGQWVRFGDVLCVRPDDATFFPFHKVVKRLVEGRGNAASILGTVMSDQPLPRPTMPGQVRPHPGDRDMLAALAQQRSDFAQRRSTLHRRTLEAIAGAAPSWMKRSDGLREAVDRQVQLLAEGTLVWASTVQANKLLFKAGDEDCPAQVVYSRGTEFDARPRELREIAKRIFKLKGTTPRDPVERAIAQKVTNEMDRTMGWPLPVELTARPAFSTAVMVWRRHLPGGVLSGGTFPALVHPATKALMMLPAEFWTDEILRLWKKGKL